MTHFWLHTLENIIITVAWGILKASATLLPVMGITHMAKVRSAVYSNAWIGIMHDASRTSWRNDYVRSRARQRQSPLI